MNKTLKLAFATVLSAAMFVPAIAQDNFPDVPENHWAYEALENLKREGILVGYPDGLFRGPRNATRYEMAIAINAAYQKLASMDRGLDERIQSLEKAIAGEGDGDTRALRDQLAALRRDLDGMRAWGDDVANLKKLAETFEKELASLGVDVEALKKDLAGIEERVSRLEKIKPAVEISGDANIFTTMGNSRDNAAGMTKDGRIVGVNVQAGGLVADGARPRAGLQDDFNVYHEIAFNFKGTNEEGPKWWATLVYGNMIGMDGAGRPLGFGDQRTRFGGSAFRQGSGDIYIQSFGVAFDTSLVGLGFSAAIGRLNGQFSSHLFKRPDNSPYFANERWDNGDWVWDGAALTFKFGAANLTVVGGKNSGIQSTNGVAFQPIPFGANAIDTTLGAQLSIPVGQMGDIKASYLYHDSNGPIAAGAANRLNVFGGEANLNISGIALYGAYGKSILTHNTSNIGLDNNNQYAAASVGYQKPNWGITGNYRRIQSGYAAQGSWQRIGTFWNPTGIESFGGKAWINIGQNLTFSYTGEFGNTINAIGLVPKDSDYQSHVAEIKYRVNESWSALLGYEDVRVELAGPDIQQKWATVGFGYALGSSSSLRFAYEYGSVSNHGYTWGQGVPGNYRGGFLTGQLSIKF